MISQKSERKQSRLLQMYGEIKIILHSIIENQIMMLQKSIILEKKNKSIGRENDRHSNRGTQKSDKFRLSSMYISAIVLGLTMFAVGCSGSLGSKVYDVRNIEQTDTDIQLQAGDIVVIHYPQVSTDLIDKFNIGEFALIDFTELLFQEFVLQLKSRGVIIQGPDYQGSGVKSLSIAITNFEDKGVPEFEFPQDQTTTQQWDNREISGGRVGYYPECYFLRGVVSLRTDMGQKNFRVVKVGSNFSYARSTDLVENIQMFTTTAINELFSNLRKTKASSDSWD